MFGRERCPNCTHVRRRCFPHDILHGPGLLVDERQHPGLLALQPHNQMRRWPTCHVQHNELHPPIRGLQRCQRVALPLGNLLLVAIVVCQNTVLRPPLLRRLACEDLLEPRACGQIGESSNITRALRGAAMPRNKPGIAKGPDTIRSLFPPPLRRTARSGPQRLRVHKLPPTFGRGVCRRKKPEKSEIDNIGNAQATRRRSREGTLRYARGEDATTIINFQLYLPTTRRIEGMIRASGKN